MDSVTSVVFATPARHSLHQTVVCSVRNHPIRTTGHVITQVKQTQGALGGFSMAPLIGDIG